MRCTGFSAARAQVDVSNGESYCHVYNSLQSTTINLTDMWYSALSPANPMHIRAVQPGDLRACVIVQLWFTSNSPKTRQAATARGYACLLNDEPVAIVHEAYHPVAVQTGDVRKMLGSHMPLTRLRY
jgi:hypothetical protein